MMRSLAVLALLAVAVAPGVRAGNPVTPEPTVDLAFNRFYDWTETMAAVERLRAAWPDWLSVEKIGESGQGRDLVAVILADPGAAPHTERPAIYIDANVHGNEIQGTETCLYTLWYLLEQKDRSEEIAALLRRVSFYVIPSVNPDAREAWFHRAATPHSFRSGLIPFDDDRDGRADEDGPNDLDGDGQITRMRKRVATGGTHRADPDDPRLLVRVSPGEEGEFLLLGREGIDDDGDGEVDEDGPGGYDMNRNFPSDWQPGWIQYGAGPWPLCWPETRAVADFVLGHPNIAALQSYHNTGGMILRGPGTKEAGEYPREDVAVYDALGRVGEEMLPHYRYMVLWRDLYPVRGGFVTWAFEGRGIFSFTNELFTGEQYRGEERERDERHRDRLRWSDRMEHGRQFRDWTPFTHPQYGEIEIGGFAKTSSRVPPLFMLEELCHRNAAFTIHHASEMPELRLREPGVEDLGDGLWRVRAEVVNRRLIPTIAAHARKNGIGTPDFFLIDVEGGEVVSGGLLSGRRLAERATPQPHRPGRLRVESGVGSHGRVGAEWIVTSPRISIRYVSEKGGAVRAARED